MSEFKKKKGENIAPMCMEIDEALRQANKNKKEGLMFWKL